MAMAAPLLATAPSPVPPASRRWRPLLAAPAPALRLKLPAPRPPQTPPLPRESRAVSVVRAATEEERGQAPDWRAPATWLALLGSAVLLGCGAALAAAEDSIRASGFGLRVAASLRTLATLPVLELRGAIPAGYWMRLHPIRLTVLAVLVSLLQLALMVVCDWELGEARKRDALDRARVRGEEPPREVEERGLHANIEGDVKDLLEGKTSTELEEMESQIESGTAKVVEYWEAILKRLHIYKAKACLREIHASLLRKHLHRLENSGAPEQAVEPDEDLDTKEEDAVHDEEEDDKRYSPEPIAEETENHLDEEAGSFSPELMHGNEDEDAIESFCAALCSLQ